MTDAEKHYSEARRLIEEAAKSGAKSLYLGYLDHLKYIPVEIAALGNLETLVVSDDAIRNMVGDLAPLRTLSNLRELGLSGSPPLDLGPLVFLKKLEKLNLHCSGVQDLRPLRELIEVGSLRTIDFTLSSATRDNQELDRIARIRDDDERSKELLEYLKNLSDPPQPGDRPAEWHDLAMTIHAIAGLRSDYNALSGRVQAVDQRFRRVALRAVKRFHEQRHRLKALEAEIAVLREAKAIAAPIALWKEKRGEHEEKQGRFLKHFLSGLLVTTVFVGAMAFASLKWRDTVELLLAPIGCDRSIPGTCDGFSLPAFLVSAGVLTVLTLLLWFTRLQMKLFVSERHLATDSREREAFTETYVSLLDESGTSREAKEHRALVYSALFRPSRDGMIADETGLDPSVTAALSKYLTQK